MVSTPHKRQSNGIFRDWDTLAAELRPEAEEAEDETELEAAVDRLVAERPLIRSEARSRRGVVASGHPLATEAGLDVLG